MHLKNGPAHQRPLIRLVAFRTKATHWHSVEKVYGWERLSILALWDVDREDRC